MRVNKSFGNKDAKEWSLPVVQTSQMGKSTSNFRLVDPYRETGNSGTWMSFRDTGYMSIQAGKQGGTERNNLNSFRSMNRKASDVFLKTKSEFSIKQVKAEGLYYDDVVKKILSLNQRYGVSIEKAKKIVKQQMPELYENIFHQKAIVSFLEDLQDKVKTNSPLNFSLCLTAFESLLKQASCLSVGIDALMAKVNSTIDHYQKKEKLKSVTDQSVSEIEVKAIHLSLKESRLK